MTLYVGPWGTMLTILAATLLFWDIDLIDKSLLVRYYLLFCLQDCVSQVPWLVCWSVGISIQSINGFIGCLYTRLCKLILPQWTELKILRGEMSVALKNKYNIWNSNGIELHSKLYYSAFVSFLSKLFSSWAHDATPHHTLNENGFPILLSLI